MEKKENFQDKSNNTNDEINPDNQKNLNQDTIEDTENANNEKVEISPEEKVKELEDKLVRAFAEMENQRRRFEKEKDDAFNYGGFNFAKESLNLLDNLERSRVSLENDEKLKNTEILKKTIEHLNIIYNDMVSIYKKNGIEEIKSIDQKLDPNLHQAMLEIEDNNKEPGTVVQEIQKGFMMKDRLLRPSLVAVSKKSSENEQKDEKLKKSQENQPKNDEK
jgi:molecular chaperone GrpE|tara:strand:- start:455 stop:1114 length:660 start_codon:yes stop_codon:yes gene_type:complete